MGLITGTCDRCHKPVNALRMSMFNTEMCCQACLHKERLHPKYDEAVRAEREAVESGNHNFPGIGKPDDL